MLLPLTSKARFTTHTADEKDKSRPAGIRQLSTNGPLVVKKGQVVAAIASSQRLKILDSLINRKLMPKDGKLHPDVRALIARLSHAAIENQGPAQAWFRAL